MMIVADLPLRWVLVVDELGRSTLYHPRRGRCALACVSGQPRTVRRLIAQLDAFVHTAEIHHRSGPTLDAARLARAELYRYAAEHLGVREISS